MSYSNKSHLIYHFASNWICFVLRHIGLEPRRAPWKPSKGLTPLSSIFLPYGQSQYFSSVIGKSTSWHWCLSMDGHTFCFLYISWISSTPFTWFCVTVYCHLTLCYGVYHVCLKPIYWSLDPQYLSIGVNLEAESSKRKLKCHEFTRVGPNSRWQEIRSWKCSEEKLNTEPGERQPSTSQTEASEIAILADTLTSSFQPPNWEEINLSCLSV